MHLLNNFKPFGDDLITLTVGIQAVDCLLHLALQTRNAA